ncbi:two-component system phosphate regulon sensor histidine kinase PhoR [Aquamicrobium ahrensii]|uniref:histidine kinase n=2 Tax=Aquamicrobium ahrensii TaxID=469551 RepID=A0ABV2KM93_9HYPH
MRTFRSYLPDIMADLSDRQKYGAQRLMRNLWRARGLLAVAIIALFCVHLFGDLPFMVLPAAIVALLLAAAISGDAEEADEERRATAEAGEMQSLSAENLAAAVTDPLIVFDDSASVIHANAAAIAAFGDLRPAMSLQLKFRAPEMQALIDAALSGGGSQSADFIDKLPVERVYRVTASAVGHGSRLHVLLFKDQSEARRIDRMRADFIANASHEMRTPLASIAGFIETLRGPARNDPAAREQFLQIMQNQTGRMARLIDDMLSLSRLEMKPYLKPGARVDVRQVVESVVDSLGPLAKESDLVIERDFADGPMETPGDRDELYQVFENLVENACKYGRDGDRIVVSIARSDKAPQPGIEVTVRDFGPGIPEEHIPRVTERFYRIDSETVQSRKGTGLGLAIVKHILTRHHGRLSIQSELGKGSAFTVYLPTN